MEKILMENIDRLDLAMKYIAQNPKKKKTVKEVAKDFDVPDWRLFW